MEPDDLLIDESDLPPLFPAGEEPDADALSPAEEAAPDSEEGPDDGDMFDFDEDFGEEDIPDSDEDFGEEDIPDSDEDSGGRKRTAKKRLPRKTLPYAAAAVLLVGLIGFGCWYFRNPAKDLVIPVTASPMEQPEEPEEPAVDVDMRGTVLTPEELIQAREDTGIEKVVCSVEICGVEVDSTAVNVDLSASTAIDLDEIREAIPALTYAQKVILPQDCGFTNEELSAFNDEMGDIRVVWTMAVGRFSTIRTDATYFCKNEDMIAVPMTNEEAQVLQYCTDIIALDLGHSDVTDIEFLRNMPNLRYLVLADTEINDISVLSDLKNLYYIELFMNTIDDLSPLLDLTNLRYLNLGWVKTKDVSPLFEMNWLEYMWYPCSSMTQQQIADLQAACPDTKMYLAYFNTYGSTGGGWHYTEGYYEQRDALHMPYLP